MTIEGDATAPSPSAADSDASGESRAADEPRRAGTPARAGAYAGRARAFRLAEKERLRTRRHRLVDGLLVASLVLVAYLIATEPVGFLAPGHPSTSVATPVGPPILVRLGTPTTGTVSCGGGGTAFTERIAWTNSTEPVQTGDVYLRVYEIWDGDPLSGEGVVANVTPTNVCAGSPPGGSTGWYVVLADANGSNLLSFARDTSWASVGTGSTNLPITDGMTLIVVTGTSLAGTGRGVEVAGFHDYSYVLGSVPL